MIVDQYSYLHEQKERMQKAYFRAGFATGFAAGVVAMFVFVVILGLAW
jgi:hypothetical protein